MRFARTTTTLGSLVLLLGGCAGLLSHHEQRDDGRPSSPLRLFEGPLAPAPAVPAGQLPTPQLWRVPALFSSAVGGDEGVHNGACLSRALAPDAPAVQLPNFRSLEFAVAPESARRASWHVTFSNRPDPVWFQRPSAVDPVPLFESAQVGRMLSDNPRAGGIGGFTGLLTSEDGPAVICGYRFDF